MTCKARQHSSDEDVSDSEASVKARYVTVSFYGLGAAGQVCARMDRLRDLKGRRRSWEAGERDGVVLRPMIRLQLDSQVFVPGRFSASAFRQQHLARLLVYCILTVWYQSFFWRHFRFSRTHFPPPRIRTNIDSAVVCCLLCARVSRSAAPGHFQLVESGHFLCVSGRSASRPSAEPFGLVGRSPWGPRKTFCPAGLSVSSSLSDRAGKW